MTERRWQHPLRVPLMKHAQRIADILEENRDRIAGYYAATVEKDHWPALDVTGVIVGHGVVFVAVNLSADDVALNHFSAACQHVLSPDLQVEFPRWNT